MKNRKRFVSVLAGVMAAIMLLSLILSLIPTRVSAASSSEIKKQIAQLKETYPFTEENALEILLQETGKVFAGCLVDAGVYKCDEAGRAAFCRFVDAVNG